MATVGICFGCRYRRRWFVEGREVREVREVREAREVREGKEAKESARQRRWAWQTLRKNRGIWKLWND